MGAFPMAEPTGDAKHGAGGSSPLPGIVPSERAAHLAHYRPSLPLMPPTAPDGP